MMLIGTSFGGCLKSILAGEVSEDDVLLIIARTNVKDVESIAMLAERYHRDGNIYASVTKNYEFDQTTDVNDVKALAVRLYLAGKIHQPRQFTDTGGFLHPEISYASLWLEVNPIGLNKNPIVIEAYEKYKVLDSLTK